MVCQVPASESCREALFACRREWPRWRAQPLIRGHTTLCGAMTGLAALPAPPAVTRTSGAIDGVTGRRVSESYQENGVARD